MKYGLITNLVGGCVTCGGLGNAYTQPLGYIIIWVQVEGVHGYNKDQIALVVLDLSILQCMVPIILETPAISCVVNVMKGEGDRCPGNAMGECQGGPSPFGVKGYNHSGGQPNCGKFWP